MVALGGFVIGMMVGGVGTVVMYDLVLSRKKAGFDAYVQREKDRFTRECEEYQDQLRIAHNEEIQRQLAAAKEEIRQDEARLQAFYEKARGQG